ncbi:MAG: glutathione S-transferase [Pseudomonadota bacterium]
MKLYFSPNSPFVRKVHVLLHELGRLEEVTLHDVTTTPMNFDSGLVATNPLGKIPALERADGTTIYDSRVITAYLNETFGGSLYPSGARGWETRVLEATGDGIMECAVAMTYEVRLREPAQQSEAWIEAQWTKASRAISALNTRWMSHLHGPLDMGQIAVACALCYLDFRHGARDWRSGHVALADWHASFDSRASMQASGPGSG